MLWARAWSFLLVLFVMMPWALAQSYCVTKNGARLRRTASAQAAVTWQVPQFMPLAGTGKKQGSWIEVRDMDDQVHWVNGAEVTTKQTCLVVKVKLARLRQGPGKSFQASEMGMADRYMAFRDLGGEDGWTQVEDAEGEKAWISLDSIWKPVRRTRVSFTSE